MRERVIEGNPGYLIFFDNVRVDKYVKSFRTNISTKGGMGQASIEMIYAPSFYQIEKSDPNGQNIIEDGIENMTNVRIFGKNMFNERYIQIFEGNLRGKSRTRTPSGYSMSFFVTDYMIWLNKTIVPLQIPFESTYRNQVDILRWKAQGIDTDKVKTIGSGVEIEFKDKNVKQYVSKIIERTLRNNKIFSTPGSVAAWDNPAGRIYVMGDIDPQLVSSQVIDFRLSTNVTSLNSIYVAFNDVSRNLMFEFFQDRDGIIRIKPPFWNECILFDHVIDPQMILNIGEDIDYTNYFSRVCVAGSCEEFNQGLDIDLSQNFTPAAVYVGDLDSDSRGFYAVANEW